MASNTVQEERRKRPGLRRVIDAAPLYQKKSLIFLARGAGPDKLDALERIISETSMTPIASVKDELDELVWGAGLRITKVLPGVLRYHAHEGLVEEKVECLEDLAYVHRISVLKERGIGRMTLEALAQVMARRGIYFKGECPD